MCEMAVFQGKRHAVCAFVALLVVAALTSLAFCAYPHSAYAASLTTCGAASAEQKAAVKDAKAIVKKAKATKGTSKAKLKKIFTYIAKDKANKGVFTYGSYHGDFYFAAVGTDDEKYYPANPPANMKGYYLKYTVDAYNSKKASCYHYAALFAVSAKVALGKEATVRIAVGSTNVTGEQNPHHAWTEVKIGKTVYVYDPMNGNYWSLNKSGKATGFGKFCGAKKSALGSYYENYQGAKYATVKI